MRIRLTRNTFVEGVSHSIGDELEVREAVGKSLVLMHKAILLPVPDPHPNLLQAEKEDKPIDEAKDGASEEDVSDAARAPVLPASAIAPKKPHKSTKKGN